VADHTRHQHLARGQFRLLPYPPLVRHDAFASRAVVRIWR
jgi:hypothetical protein